MERMWKTTFVRALRRAVTVALTVTAAILLPQMFHAVGVMTGHGGAVGQMFLPMYLPVLVVALKTDAVIGAAAGLLSPLFSFMISGMPSLTVLPFVTVELVCFGVLAGLLASKPMNLFGKIAMTQLGAWVVRFAVTLIAALFCGELAAAWTAAGAVFTAIPGYLLQLAVVPLLVRNGAVRNA